MSEATTAEVKTEAFQRTQKQIQEAIDAGNPLNPVQTNAAFLENLDQVVNERLERIQKGEFRRDKLNFSQLLTNDLNEMQRNVTEGKTGIERFPVRIRKLAAKRGITPTYNNLSKLFQSQLKSSLGADGRPEFPQPGETLRRTIVEGENPKNSSQPQNGRSYGGPSRPSDIRERRNQSNGDQSSNNSNKGPDVAGFVLDGLTRIAGTLLPGGGSPVAAAESSGSTSVLNEEQVELLARMWNGKQQPTLQTDVLPQVSAETQVQSVPIAIKNDRHPFFIAIGIAEGTRTADGGYTRAYYGHTDPGDGNLNRGTVSGGRGNNMTPQQVDAQWMGVLTQTSLQSAGMLQRLGLRPGTQGFNRVMFNILDLSVQSPAAVRDFLLKLPKVGAQGFTVESIAKARADSFYRYDGTLDAPGFGNSYNRLFTDQRSRAGVFDYKRRF